MLKRRLLVLAPILLPLVVCSDTRVREPNRLLAAADRLAMLYNWPEAIPLYAQSEILFQDAGDRKNALAAKFKSAPSPGFVRPGFGTSVHGPKKKRFCFS